MLAHRQRVRRTESVTRQVVARWQSVSQSGPQPGPRGKCVPKQAGAQRYSLPRDLSGHTISCHRGLEPCSVQHRFPATEFRRFGSRVHQPGRSFPTPIS